MSSMDPRDEPRTSGSKRTSAGPVPSLDLSTGAGEAAGVERLPTTAGLPIYRVTGDPEQAAGRLGELLRDRIGAAWRLYSMVFGLPETQLLRQAEHFAGQIRAYAPALEREMSALAEGAGVDPRIIVALNSRSEILHGVRAAAECTSVHFERTAILAQNWDWAEALEELIVLVEYHRPDGLKILTLTEPGILAKIGFNSAGLGVTLNITGGNEPADGVPVHVLLRSVLECRSIDEGVAAVLRARTGTMSALLMADAAGERALVEIHGRALRVERQGEGPFVHTNHHLCHGSLPISKFFDDSYDRFDRATELVRASAAQTIEQMKSVLLDRSHPINPINVPYTEIEGLGRMGTVVHLVMDLPARTMHLARAGAGADGFESVGLDA